MVRFFGLFLCGMKLNIKLPNVDVDTRRSCDNSHVCLKIRTELFVMLVHVRFCKLFLVVSILTKPVQHIVTCMGCVRDL
jgi:hypothetical protein